MFALMFPNDMDSSVEDLSRMSIVRRPIALELAAKGVSRSRESYELSKLA